MSLLTFPVSLVDRRWAEVNIIRAGQTREPGLLRIVADEAGEAVFLENWLGYTLCQSGRPLRTVDVRPEDYPGLWKVLCGNGEPKGQSGVLFECSPGSLVMVRGAFLVPEECWDTLAERMHRLATAMQLTLLCPMARSVAKHAGDHLLHGAIIEIPAFSDYPPKLQTALAQALIERSAAEEGVEVIENLALELVRDRPRSRAELQGFVENALSGKHGGERLLTEAVHLPVPDLSQRQLRARHDRWRILWKETSARYEALVRRPLFKPPRELIDPLSHETPEAWFLSILSGIANLLFDCADPGFRVVQQLHLSAGAVEHGPPRLFLADLRALRTRLQHGLDWSKAKDVQTRRRAAGWFEKACGNSTPRPSDYRLVIAALLDDATSMISSVDAVLRIAATGDQRDLFITQVLASGRRLPRWEWHRLAEDRCTRLAPDVDPVDFVDRRLTVLEEKLAASDVRRSPAEVLAEASRLLEELVLHDATRPPVCAEDFLDAGVPKGPSLGIAMRTLAVAFEREPSASKETLLRQVLDSMGTTVELHAHWHR